MTAKQHSITVQVDDVLKKAVVVAPLSAADTAGQISRSLASGRAKWDEKGCLVVVEHGVEIPVVLSPESQRQMAAAQEKRARRAAKRTRIAFCGPAPVSGTVEVRIDDAVVMGPVKIVWDGGTVCRADEKPEGER